MHDVFFDAICVMNCGISFTSFHRAVGVRYISRDEGLDGIDFDFEGIRSVQEWTAYLAFLSEASDRLHRAGLLATVALHPGQHLPSNVCAILDRVHVMTYDMMIRQPSSSTATTDRHHHHASMHVVEDAMEGFVRTGCPPSKLVMGIPAYGRHERDPGLVRTYSELVDEIIIANNGGGDDGMSETETEATTAKTTTAVVLRSINSRSGYRFDSPDDVRAKVEYALRSGLGGVFIWELGQDKRMPGQAEGGVLLEAAAAAAASAVDRPAGDVPGDEL